ncbi:MAG TPA: hypothetical protein VJ872_11270 [Nocardioides sp.]|nr:hypothetical protein [Nocardioides sp.]
MTAIAEPVPGAHEGWEHLLEACLVDLALLGPEIAAGAVGAAVLADGRDGLFTADANGENAHTACEIEALTGSGPGSLALDRSEIVWVPDVAAEHRWRPWRRAVKGIWSSALALPVKVDGTPGAVILYASTGPGAALLLSLVAAAE